MSKDKRSKLDLFYDTLQAICEGKEGKTELIYCTNSCWMVLVQNIAKLLSMKLIVEKKKGCYEPTAEGLRVGQMWRRLKDEYLDRHDGIVLNMNLNHPGDASHTHALH